MISMLMTVNDFCTHFIKSPEYRKSRLLFAPNKQDYFTLRNFCINSDFISRVRISDCIHSNNYIPSGGAIFSDLHPYILKANKRNQVAFVEGFDAINALWSDENSLQAYYAIRNLLDDASLHFLIITDSFGDTAKTVFSHPRYHEANLVIRFGNEASPEKSNRDIYLLDTMFSKIQLNGCHLKSLAKYIEECENNTLADGNINIFLDFKGGSIPGFSPVLRQIYTKGQLLQQFCELKDNLPECAFEWLYSSLLEEKEIIPALTLAQKHFFPDGVVNDDFLKKTPKAIQLVDSNKKDILLWTVRNSVRKNTYLSYVVNNEEVTPDNFISFYVCEAEHYLNAGNAEQLQQERKDAMLQIGTSMLEAEIADFINCLKDYPSEQVIPWLNCESPLEKIEIVRRIVNMDQYEIPNCVSKSYPLLGKYLTEYCFGSALLNQYFTQYRHLKLKDTLTEDFSSLAKEADPNLEGITSRDSLLQTYCGSEDTALLVVDALGAEYMPMILTIAKDRNLGIEREEAVFSKLPTSTEFNPMSWPEARKIPEIKALDGIIHNGAEIHSKKTFEENFVATLEVFNNKIFTEISKALAKYPRVILTSDHGATRLAVRAQEKGMSQKVVQFKDVDNCRYTTAIKGQTNPDKNNIYENISGDYWLVKGYNCLAKKTGISYETHGGVTYEEMLVPFIVFKKGATYTPKMEQNQSTDNEITENDDFDL